MEIKEIFRFQRHVRPIVWYWRVLLAIWMILFIPLLVKLPSHMVFSFGLLTASGFRFPPFFWPLFMMIVFTLFSPKSELWTGVWRCSISSTFFVVYLSIFNLASFLDSPQASYLQPGTIVDFISYGETMQEPRGVYGARGTPISREVVVVSDPLDWGSLKLSFHGRYDSRKIRTREPNSLGGQLQRNLANDTSVKEVHRYSLFTKNRH